MPTPRPAGSVPAACPVAACLAAVLTVCLVSFVSPVLAAQPATASDDDTAATTSAAHRPVATLAETVTVTASRSERRLADTPGQVTVIDGEEIERRQAADAADLVRYEPGVYADNDPTRLGVGGFNVRGIGGNRVLTRIDGVPVADGFDFERLAVNRYSLDPEVLRRVEIVRSAGSALYGSDALGGVVSLLTKDPADYLASGGGNGYLGARLGWDGRGDETSGSLTAAAGSGPWQGSLWLSRRDGSQRDNQGRVASRDGLRTAPNPVDRSSTNALGKLTWAAGDSTSWKLAVETWDADAATEVLSRRGVEDLGPTFGPGVTFLIDTRDFDAEDSQQRRRVSLELQRQLDGWLADSVADNVVARLYGQRDDSEQTTLESRATTSGGSFFGPVQTSPSRRDAALRFEQETVGGEVQVQRAWGGGNGSQLLTWGVAASRDRFDMLRRRRDVDAESGAEIPSSMPFPSKYFPRSTMDELGVFVQQELELLDGRLRLVPGLRYDRFALDADQDDAVFFAGNPGTPPPVDLTESAVSPRFGAVYRLRDDVVVYAQYAAGFRAPSYAYVNNGFSNFAFGYRTLPNPDLRPESSDDREVGVRWLGRRGSLSVAAFDNRYDDFIDIRTVGVDPASGLLDFQAQNVATARIRGVELSGDLSLGDAWRLRTAASWMRGDDEAEGRPLNSVPPPQLVAGLGYRPASGRWGAELTATVSRGKDADRVDRSAVDQFAPPGYELVDLTGFYRLGGGLRLQLALRNLLDETYWQWPDVVGQSAGSPVLDRFTSPGLNAAVTLRWSR